MSGADRRLPRTVPMPESPEVRLQRRIAALVGRPLFWMVLVGLIFSWPIARAVRETLPPALPFLGTVASFASVDQQGRPLGDAQLRGRVWIADFLDVRCAAAALSSDRMRQLQHRGRNLGDALHLVTFMLNPSSLETRLAWARAHAANPRLWSFLGDEPGVALSMKRIDGGCTAPQALFLLDAHLRLRGIYDPALEGTLDLVLRDAGLLINRDG